MDHRLDDRFRGLQLMGAVSRIFANAVARRSTVLLVAVALAWVGSAEAQVGDYPYCTTRTTPGSPEMCPDQGEAVVNAYRVARANLPEGGSIDPSPFISGNLVRVYVRSKTGGLVSSGDRQWPSGKTCAARPSQSTLFLPPGGSTRCNSGCEQKYTWMGADSTGQETSMANYTGAVCDPSRGKDECEKKNPGGTSPPTVVWNGYLGVCQPINTECPSGQSAGPDGKCKNNDDCPATHVLNSSGVCVKKDEDCAAGTIRGLDGMCKQDDDTDKSKCPTGQAKGKDGTCKPDKNNDGIPDSDQDPDDPNNNEDGKEFSGGDNCNVPPSCAGDPIMCGQARIQWRIECNTRKAANVAGGTCSSIPVCTGEGCKPMEYQQLLMQWRTACAVEKLAQNGLNQPGEGVGTVPVPDTSGVSDGALESALGPHGEGEPGDAFTDGSEGGQEGGVPGSNGLNTQGYGWSRSCPSPPTIDLMGQSITFDIGPFCNWMALGGWMVLIVASLVCIRILASSGN